MDSIHPSRILLREYLKENATRARELFNRIKPSTEGGLNARAVLDAQNRSLGMIFFEEIQLQNSTLEAALNDLARYARYTTVPKTRPPIGHHPPHRKTKSCTIAAEKAAIVILGPTA